METNKKILIFRLSAIGDVVHSTIISEAIKKKHQNCEVHFITDKSITSLLEPDPNLSKVIPFDCDKSNDIFYLLNIGLQLRKEKYDAVLNLSNTLRNILLNFIMQPKLVIKRSKNRVHAVDAFYNTACDIFADLEKPKNLKLHIDEVKKNKIYEQIKSYQKPYVVISPGGENDVERQGRIWGDKNWIEFGNKLIEKFGGTIFIAGSKAEKEEHKKYLEIKNSVLYSGELSLDESAALFSLANLFLSGDSGPLHIASALNINTIGIMGSTNPVSCSPYGDKGYYIEPSIDCRYCGNKTCEKLQEGEKYTPCIQSITSEMLLNFIKENNLL